MAVKNTVEARLIGKFKDEISSGVEKVRKLTERSFNLMTGAIKGAFNILTSWKTLLAGAAGAYGAGALASSMLDVASSMETYQGVLTTVLKDERAAVDLFGWIKDFAKTTPFEVPGLVEAATRLQTYGLDAQKYMKTLGDTAAALGKPLMSAVEAVADAAQGEYERLKEFGLRATDVAAAAGFATVQEMNSSRENLAKGTEAIMALFEQRYAGGMETLSKTWIGLKSNLLDIWTNFQAKIMDAGIFDKLKGYLKEIIEYFDRLEKLGKLDEWAQAISDNLVVAAEGVRSMFDSMVSALGAAHESMKGDENIFWEFLKSAAEGFKTYWIGFWGWFQSDFVVIKEAIRLIWHKLFDPDGDMPKDLKEFEEKTWNPAWDRMKQRVESWAYEQIPVPIRWLIEHLTLIFQAYMVGVHEASRVTAEAILETWLKHGERIINFWNNLDYEIELIWYRIYSVIYDYVVNKIQKGIWEPLKAWVNDYLQWWTNINDKAVAFLQNVGKIIYYLKAGGVWSAPLVLGGSAGDILGGAPTATGLSYVPYDNYHARLHKGERVLTAEQNRTYNTRNQSLTVNVTVNQAGADLDPYAFAKRLSPYLKTAWARGY